MQGAVLDDVRPWPGPCKDSEWLGCVLQRQRWPHRTKDGKRERETEHEEGETNMLSPAHTCALESTHARSKVGVAGIDPRTSTCQHTSASTRGSTCAAAWCHGAGLRTDCHARSATRPLLPACHAEVAVVGRRWLLLKCWASTSSRWCTAYEARRSPTLTGWSSAVVGCRTPMLSRPAASLMNTMVASVEDSRVVSEQYVVGQNVPLRRYAINSSAPGAERQLGSSLTEAPSVLHTSFSGISKPAHSGNDRGGGAVRWR